MTKVNESSSVDIHHNVLAGCILYEPILLWKMTNTHMYMLKLNIILDTLNRTAQKHCGNIYT